MKSTLLRRDDGAVGRGTKHPLAWYTPRFWHGMTLSTWMRELRRNRFALSPTRVPMALTISAVAAVNSGLAAIERIFHRRVAGASELSQAPLFILGHWRSGTTFLHELLVRDPSHSFANTYQCFAPHHFRLTEDWLVPCIEGLLPKRRPMDNMAAGWDRPMEDEFALQNLGVPSPYLMTMFPERGATYAEYLTLRNLTLKQREQWKSALLEFCLRLTSTDRRRLVMKSPTHTARIRTLLEIFPTAKFIHVSREPQTMFRSTVDLWRTLNSEVGLQCVRQDEWLEPFVVDNLRRMYEAYFEDRKLLTGSQIVELRYEDLVGDPLGELESAYDRLGLGDYSIAEPIFQQHLTEVGAYRRNSHVDDERSRRLVEREWGAYADYFGYASSTPATRAA